MKRWVFASIFSWVLLLGCATSRSDKPAAQEMGQQVTSLRSTSGMRVHLLPWGAADKQEALLLLRGVEHPWAEKIVLHKVEPCRHGQCYSTEVNGQRWTTLLLGPKGAELYLPFLNEDMPTKLSVSDAEDAPKPQELAKMFESQK
ncbi:MAG: hypothetical protein FWC28_06245 [Proteobacteria bacterium]|nr:hypothetical protein [Cystobacterineae bacterium]MCL2258857.1 hypothetical protein [Cystobacterineae bacterium]MCL2314833.1 hypothetical protein [Pseudomonadota bacterium]